MKKWTIAVIGILSYVVTTFGLLYENYGRIVDKARKVAQEAAAAQRDAARILGAHPEASWNYENPDIVRMIGDLKLEQEKVAEKIAQSEEYERRLKFERQEITTLTVAINKMQADLNQLVNYIEKEQKVNLKKLADKYVLMNTQSVLNILKQGDDAEFAKILSLMREREASAILDLYAKGGAEDLDRVSRVIRLMTLTIEKDGGSKLP
jgi:hypothetical protein